MLQCSLGSIPVLCATRFPGSAPRRLTFEGVLSQHTWPLADLDAEFPTDWSAYAYLVMELRVSTPQRFFVRAHTPDGVRVLRIQPVGQGVWFRAAIPLRYLQGQDQEGHDLASGHFSCFSLDLLRAESLVRSVAGTADLPAPLRACVAMV